MQSEEGSFDVASSLDKLRVLLVEDTMDEALLVKTSLLQAGDFEIVLVQDGDQAIEVLAKGEWALALVDLNLPGRDGIEVIKEAVKLHPDLPVIAMTSYTGQVYFDQAFRVGAKYVLKKPFDKDEMLSKVAEFIDLGVKGVPTGPETVVAVGARPGDIEIGCAGSLLYEVESGHDVTILVIAGGSLDGSDCLSTAAQRAADQMGARLMFGDIGEPKGMNIQGAAKILVALIEEMNPSVLYMPSESDREQNRINTFRVCTTAGSDIAQLLAYEGPTSSMEFEPTMFRPVSSYLKAKMDAVSVYENCDLKNVSRDYVMAAARYWSRFDDEPLVEPLEDVSARGL
ncbi:MAG: hypothetical protein BMS9Abin29_2556 [Gemmatimonadota bacterium]|nr:MAG: hypothetical protein BMS9Abin29_2556 [Gemmatimonadota bacterium]